MPTCKPAVQQNRPNTLPHAAGTPKQTIHNTMQPANDNCQHKQTHRTQQRATTQRQPMPDNPNQPTRTTRAATTATPTTLTRTCGSTDVTTSPRNNNKLFCVVVDRESRLADDFSMLAAAVRFAEPGAAHNRSASSPPPPTARCAPTTPSTRTSPPAPTAPSPPRITTAAARHRPLPSRPTTRSSW